MFVESQTLLFTSAVVMKVGGVLCMLSLRCGQSSLAWRAVQRMFLASILLLGIGAAGAVVTNTGYGLPLGMTVCLLTVAATFDPRRGGSVPGSGF